MHKVFLAKPLSFFFFLFLLGLPFRSSAQLPEDFYEESIASFNLPVGLTFDNRGYGYVWEKGGIVWVVDSNEVRLPVPLLDLSEEVAEWRDHGLLGFALDPDFLFNGHIYCMYTVDRHHLFHFGSPQYHPDSTIVNQATIGRITRFTATANSDFTQAPFSSRQVLLGKSMDDAIPIPNNLHGVGSLAFGDDGSLLASTGDGGPDLNPQFAGDFHIEQALEEGIISPQEFVGPFRTQLLESLCGKILRIDPQSGDGLSDNPFYDAAAPRAAKSRVWTLGIRNPYRMEVIPGTGSHDAGQGNPGIIVFGDVGDGQWEEVNFIPGAGLNCGWPVYEGFQKSWKWSGTLRQNQYAPNPLSGNSNCEKAYFDFQDLLLPAHEKGDYYWINPCDDNKLIPESIPRFYHHWPVVDYSNQMWNKPSRARTASFDENGQKKISLLSDADALVKGPDFDGFSAMAGFWYGEGDLPEAYHHSYWIADYSGWIRILKLNENYQIEQIDTFTSFDRDIVDLAFNPHREAIYYVDLSSGKLHKILYGLNPPPIAIVERDTIWGTSPLTVAFDASDSYHPKGLPFVYNWDFGDGTTSDLANPTHTFTAASAAPESFITQLSLTDSIGKIGQKEILVSLNNSPPQVKISSVADGDLYPMGGYTSLPLRAAVSDAEHQDEELTYVWQTYLHHNVHFHPEPIDTNRQTYTLIDPLGCSDELYYFRIRLEVSDPQGLQSSDEVMIFPNCDAGGREVNLTAEAQESSIILSWDLAETEGLKNISIQRVSSRAENWEIGQVDLEASGSYAFEDLNPIQGINSYRLQFNLIDSTYDYSNFVNLLFPTPPPLALFPNPADTEITIQVAGTRNQELNWRILALDGRELKTGNFESSADDFTQQDLNLLDFTNGVYLFEISIGEQRFTEKMVIQR